MFEKYNAVLRSKNGVPPLKKRFDELCRGNEYTTTIHALSSALVKLGKLTKAQTVYRGMKGARLPPEMLVADAKNIRGGVEFSFMSTTVRARAAVVPLTALRRRACAAHRTFGADRAPGAHTRLPLRRPIATWRCSTRARASPS